MPPESAGGQDASPEPPEDLATRSLPLVTVPRAQWYRGHRAKNHPLYFNRGAMGRFNAPGGEFGVLYLGENDLCAFVEAFCHDERLRTVTEGLLARSCLCPIRTTRTTRLVDLTTGPTLRRIGADSRVCSGPWSVSRRWALTLWRHPDRPDGLLYRSRVAPELRAMALFDRAADAVMVNCAESALIQPEHLSRILDYHDLALF